MSPINIRDFEPEKLSVTNVRGNNLLLKYNNKPVVFKTTIVKFATGVYRDARGRHLIDIELDPELRDFFTRLDGRLKTIAEKRDLQYLWFLKKARNTISLRVPTTRGGRITIDVVSRGELGSVSEIGYGEAGEITMTLPHMWIMNASICGPLLSLQRIELALRVPEMREKLAVE